MLFGYFLTSGVPLVVGPADESKVRPIERLPHMQEVSGSSPGASNKTFSQSIETMPCVVGFMADRTYGSREVLLLIALSFACFSSCSTAASSRMPPQERMNLIEQLQEARQ